MCVCNLHTNCARIPEFCGENWSYAALGTCTRERAFSGFPIAEAAQHKRPTAGACPALLRRPGQAGSETGSSVGIAETTYLGFLEDKESHIEVSRLCNQYKYALPTSDCRKDGGELHHLWSICLLF